MTFALLQGSLLHLLYIAHNFQETSLSHLITQPKKA